MSKVKSTSQLQAENAVAGLLSRVLPGCGKSNSGKKKQSEGSKKGSKAQLIDRHLKERISLQKRDALKIKRKEKKIQYNKVKHQKLEDKKLEQAAKLKVLEKHRADGTLTSREKLYLDKLLKKNIQAAKSWSLDDADREELSELQNFILSNSAESKNAIRSRKRRSRVKQFKENIRESTNNVADYKYPGLTPGLAPVGLSDEEESSDEEQRVDAY
ncbi:Rrt14p KNAG_0M01900 [Huiozyma naganishii CBS 8797]|uniref:Regulator of rDNA transcription 14 n=1 Tax=Huiozyma naganishii (strain ATCC MYA-139 / BCRC 22969 / CBS 8797 / KCTC 17520 / NBRC 10181 / NCYC 3082 / Yp74L-3) TaxID=1071383 RepID=J7RSZ3_HUIN7|nr:hypothetical protein KNAG_0M01900 [Kazachstania naganishii CBS 8797]CCK73043.1 hypothetical protein KNAG_0M01900 [Kazachstania naganishii CBS 8797]